MDFVSSGTLALAITTLREAELPLRKRSRCLARSVPRLDAAQAGAPRPQRRDGRSGPANPPRHREPPRDRPHPRAMGRRNGARDPRPGSPNRLTRHEINSADFSPRCAECRSSGSVGAGNKGTIRYIDSLTNANMCVRAAGVATSDPVQARGVAVRDGEPNVAYVLDGNNNTVRRVPSTGSDRLQLGQHLFSGLQQPGRCALRFGREPLPEQFDGDLQDHIERGGVARRGRLQWPRSDGHLGGHRNTGSPRCRQGCRLGVPGHPQDGARDLVIDGLTSPVAVAFSRDLATGERFCDVAESTRILRLADPLVKFTGPGSIPVLIHKYQAGGRLPERLPGRGSQDLRRIRGWAPQGRRQAVLPVNRSEGHGSVCVHRRQRQPGGPGTLSVPDAVSDPKGTVRTVLTITDAYAGDNYQVEASLVPFATFQKTARTGVLTAWKRAYVEYDRMYKVGEFISETSGVGQPDATKVYVVDPATFSIGDEVHVLSGTFTAKPSPRPTASAERSHRGSGPHRCRRWTNNSYLYLDRPRPGRQLPTASLHDSPAAPAPSNRPLSFSAERSMTHSLSGGL